ncbi:MAG: hypothetical protein RIQ34_1723 [Bacteroidota bacterium]
MTFTETIFLGITSTGILGLFLIYLGYPLMVLLLPKRNRPSTGQPTPTAATLIIPAWREGKGLDQKLENTLALNTSEIEVQVIVITDQSKSAELPAHIQWITETERLGKAASLNRAMQQVNTPIVIFSDANTHLNPAAILQILRSFTDPSIGAVAGEKGLMTDRDSGVRSERIYWNYESALKKLDARFNSVVGGAGELLAIRSDYFVPLPPDSLLDDLVISWEIVKQGHRIAYAPDARALETPSRNLREEATRKIRIAAGGYQFLDRHPLYAIFAISPSYAFQFLFRKWARWRLAPVLMILALIGNTGLLYVAPTSHVTEFITSAQVSFYALAALGFILEAGRVKLGWLAAPFYFVFMHVCQIRGWLRYRFGHQSVLWERTTRS